MLHSNMGVLKSIVMYGYANRKPQVFGVVRGIQINKINHESWSHDQNRVKRNVPAFHLDRSGGRYQKHDKN